MQWRGTGPWDAQVHVPLIMRLLDGLRVTQKVRTIGVMATLLELPGISGMNRGGDES